MAYSKKRQKAQKNTGSYYPFGLKQWGYNDEVEGGNDLAQQWSYLGQERQDELGLNWLTFRYRNYMPDIGRFFGSDPITEEYYSISNYQFAHNSPVWKIEIEGLEGAPTAGFDIPGHEPVKGNPAIGTIPIGDGTGNHGSNSRVVYGQLRVGSKYVGGYPGQVMEEAVTSGIQYLGGKLAGSNVSRGTSENIQLSTNIFILIVSRGRNKKAGSEVFEQLTKTASSKSLTKISLNTSKLAGNGGDALDGIIKKTNNIGTHLSPKDLQGAVKDILGEPVKIGGKVFDHLGEVNDALKGLGKQINKLNKGIDAGTFSDEILDSAKSLRTQLQGQKDQIQNVLNNARKEASGF